ncbi:MAG: primosomal replication protein N [Pseudomonadales bacterium]|nr:primosomal replication protein N [Pseudomonadales bacterium]
MEKNCLELSGRVLKTDALRHSPAGIPHQRFILEHRSKQLEAGLSCEARCQVMIQVSGDALQQSVKDLEEGEYLVVTGFIGRVSYQAEPYRLLLHATKIERGAS